jgi:hypothetical protein
MEKHHEVLREVEERFGEWIEMAGEDAPALKLHLLATMLIEERMTRRYYETIANRYAYAKK